MSIDVTSIFAEKLARNRGLNPYDPGAVYPSNYGVSASLDGNVLIVTLTFRSGVAYCCLEPGCHLCLPDTKRWDGFRRAMTERGLVVPRRLDLELSCVIEEGAICFDIFKPDPARRGWYEFTSASAQQNFVTQSEVSE